MIASPLVGLNEAASVAENEGMTEITIDGFFEKAIKADYFVTHSRISAGRLRSWPYATARKDRKARGLAPPS